MLVLTFLIYQVISNLFAEGLLVIFSIIAASECLITGFGGVASLTHPGMIILNCLGLVVAGILKVMIYGYYEKTQLIFLKEKEIRLQSWNESMVELLPKSVVVVESDLSKVSYVNKAANSDFSLRSTGEMLSILKNAKVQVKTMG